jgi:starvation-inducible DNA-binding protein
MDNVKKGGSKMTTTQMVVKNTDSVTKDLQDTLVDLIDLSLQGKQAHWNLTGPHFRELHLQLDEMVDEYRTWFDDVAERSVALGVPADGRADTIAGNSKLPPAPAGWIPDREVIDMFVDRLTGVAARLRERVDRLGETDPITQDLLIGIVHGLEKQLWMIRAQKS